MEGSKELEDSINGFTNSGASTVRLGSSSGNQIHTNKHLTVSRRKNTQQNGLKKSNAKKSDRPESPIQIKRYYIDELGFYRHLDPEQRQYVCSNLNSANLKAAANETKLSDAKASGDGGYEICYREIRHELGISHFDRTQDYETWKRGWDDFIRLKLTKQEPVTLNRELKNRVRTGIPHDYRCKMWTALIKMRSRVIRAQSGDDIYNILLRDFVSKLSTPEYPHDDQNNNIRTGEVRAAKHSSYLAPIQTKSAAESGISPALESVLSKCFKQIELDLLRTLPNNRHFEDPNSKGIQRVRRVLRAYACFNPTVGYCQGMNRLAAMALLVLPEEEAFWCLVVIIQCIMPKDYYLKPWLAQVDCCVLSDLIEKKMPKLHKHLVKNDIQLTLFTWFFTIFVDGFRPELMLRIWDCFLLEGDKVLFRFALAILYIYQEDLLAMHGFSTMSTHLSRLVSTRRLDVEHLFETFNTMNPLSSAKIQSRRDFHRARMQPLVEEY